ncbi:Peroxidase 72 [Zea mays]|uniref:Peroxidase 1 n=1 Tax=Zea mays TaxID=4577 RepID=A0A1D6J6Y5_MAIZE|nr:Peroxidase 72 [Zea mays]
MARRQQWSRGGLAAVAVLAVLCVLCSGHPVPGGLQPHFYDHACPQMQAIVGSVVAKAHAEDPRMAASLLRMHFHDCFVQGCDASVLLDADGSGRFVTEKRSNPNKDSLRGFEVIDEIKAALEHACPRTVSCADIVAVAARDSVVLTGGPGWEVPLGRRDSLTASLSGSNNLIPAPNDSLPTIIGKFANQGLDIVDLVALSGGHTIGDSRCVSFRQRLYGQNNNGQVDQGLFFDHFAKSMVKMGNISPLTGSAGEIRHNCRRVNH